MKVLRVEAARVVDFCGNSKLSGHSRRRSSTAERLQKEDHQKIPGSPVGIEPGAEGSGSKLHNQRAMDSWHLENSMLALPQFEAPPPWKDWPSCKCASPNQAPKW